MIILFLLKNNFENRMCLCITTKITKKKLVNIIYIVNFFWKEHPFSTLKLMFNSFLKVLQSYLRCTRYVFFRKVTEKLRHQCVCFILLSLLFPYRGGRLWALSSESKIDQVDGTDWMTFLSSNIMKEVSPNPGALSTNT